MIKIKTLHLYPLLTNELLFLLRNLSPTDWLKPSPIKERTVKDLVSHLIDGSLRRLSMQRDGFFDATQHPNTESYTDLVNFIQKLNTDWITVSRRFSPAILIHMLEYAEKNLHEFFKTLKPHDKAFFAVAWAGEEESENWFDIAREYTEKWHHQMQIRLALNKPLLMKLKFIEPLYDTFMVGLPYLYNKSDIQANDGDTIQVTITGNLNKSYSIIKEKGWWISTEKIHHPNIAKVEIPEKIAWILFTNTDRNKQKYQVDLKIEGNSELGLKILDFVTVMS